MATKENFRDRVRRHSLAWVMSDKTRVRILGGGFGGLYAALEFEKRNDPRFEVTVVNQLEPIRHEHNY